MKTTYINRYSGAIFTVIGQEAEARMDALACWARKEPRHAQSS